MSDIIIKPTITTPDGIKAIFFDLDNTLIDFKRMKLASCDAAMDAMISSGLKVDKKEGLRLLFKLYSRYGVEYQRIFQRFLERVIGRVDYPIMAAGIVAYRKVKDGLLCPYPKVPDILTSLKNRGYMLVILTDAPRLQAWTRLAAMGLHLSFDRVFTYDDVGKRKKPSGLPLNFAIQQVGLEPAQVLMVGDSNRRDMKPAKRLGLRTAWAKYGQAAAVEKMVAVTTTNATTAPATATRGGKKTRVEPDYVLEKPYDLLKILI